MVLRFRFFRPDWDIDAMYLQIMRDAVERSRKMLAKPIPDSFVGRKTQAPFPVEEDDPMQRPQIQNLINSELKPPE